MPRQRKKLLFLLLFQLAAASVVSAQTADPHTHESEWKNYKLPSVEFARYVDPNKIVLIRAPATWERAGNLQFKGPFESELRVIVEKVPDGIPLKSYTNAVLHQLRNLPGGADSLTVRETEISGLEAREFFFTMPNVRGESTRRMIWCTVSGPNAVSFVFISPEANAAELEPYFKGVIESAIVFESSAEYEVFEGTRSAAIKDNKPVRIDQVRRLAEIFQGFDDNARAKACETLVSIFDSTPDAAVELLIDHDPLVRAGAIEALGRSSLRGLDGFLLRALADQSATVAVRAARSLAKRDDVIKLLRDDSAGWEGLQRNRLIRIVPFLNESARNQLVSELLQYKASTKPPSVPPPPPAAAIRGPVRRPQQSKNGAISISVREPTGKELKSLGVVNISAASRSVIDNEGIVLDLVPDLEVLAALLPAKTLLEDQWDASRVLHLALASRTKLPVASLMNLLMSKQHLLMSKQHGTALKRLVALNLAVSATSRDIPAIEEAAKKLDVTPEKPDDKQIKPLVGALPEKSAGKQVKPLVNVPSEKSGVKPGPPQGAFIIDKSDDGQLKKVRPLKDELKVTIKKIQWRERFEAAEPTSREALFNEAFADDDLAAWAWPYIREHIEGTSLKQARPLLIKRQAVASADQKQPTGTVSPLAENLLPARITLYAAIPDAGSFVDKLAESLSSIQLDSASAQAKLLLVFKFFENRFGKFFGVRAESSLLQSSGVRPHSAAVFARWTADGAPRGIETAQRKAVIFRIQDRDRFEQLISAYHEFGRFEMLPEYVSAGARFFSAFPAILPLAANMINGQPTARPESTVRFHQTLIGYDTCEGYPVTVFERRESLIGGEVIRDTIYLAYVGDAAILAFDLFSLRDCLARVASKGETLANNSSFKQAVAAGGDVIYLSEPFAMMKATARKGKSPQLVERGALRISKATWESSFDLSFAATGWQKLFSFKPASLKAPGALLPRSSIAYLLMSFDFATGWRLFSADLFGPESAKSFTSTWSVDFEKEVLPELGPECGAVLLGMPALKKDKLDAPWALFIQTRSDKLGKLLTEGKLIKGAAPSVNSVRIKIGTADFWLAARAGFLVFANSEAALNQLNNAEHLAGSREFEKALKTSPSEVVAFGGISLDAATAGVSSIKDPIAAEGVDVLLSLARAFHSLNIHAAATETGLGARMSVSLDREGRYSVSDLAAVAKEFQFAAAEIEARGVPIVDQRRIDSLSLRITSKAAGVLQRIKQDVTSDMQSVEEKSDGLLLTVKPRRTELTSKIELPITKPEFTDFLKPEDRQEDKTVLSQAREIVGNDRDAWSAARKLAEWTFKNLKWKRVDGASAAATLATREADCLEFSQLFVAMARAVGLPARIVSGLVHSGNSFGGHAWVEVWVGEWVELDPTWGTNFVDATHIRSSSSELLAYAALNVIGIEVVESKRGIPDFQKDPKALVEAICGELNGGPGDVLSVAIDSGRLIESLMGDGSWRDMTSAEREQVYSAHQRLISELHEDYELWYLGAGTRMLKLNLHPEKAEALLLTPGYNGGLIGLDLIRKDGTWFVSELRLEDLDYNVIAESLKPTISLIQAKRNATSPPRILASAESRILEARGQNIQLALQVADQALRENPTSKSLRYLKGLCLLESIKGTDVSKTEEAIKLLSSLAEEQTNYVPALKGLGDHYSAIDEDDPQASSKQEKAIGFLKRYSVLSPADPRPHQTMAEIYEAKKDPISAEREYRAVIELDPLNPQNYRSLARFLMTQKRFKDSLAVVDQTRGRGSSKHEVFASLFLFYGETESIELVEGLAAESADRLNASFDANINLASLRIGNDRAREALPLLKRAIELNAKNATPHTMVAEAHRKLHNWPAALKSADAALAIDDKDAEAHFHRACALAQLRRPQEALASLKKSIELDDESYSAEDIEAEADLKPLAKLPAFKKLLEKIKSAEDAPEPQKK